jgi:hypothetical protein
MHDKKQSRIVRTIGIDQTISNINSSVTIYDTYSCCLVTAGGPAIILGIGWTAAVQAVICDPYLMGPKDKIDHVYLHNIFCPHCLDILKKRKLLGDNDTLDPLTVIIVCVGGVFYSCDIKTGSITESDSLVAPTSSGCAAFFGMFGTSQKKGWDFVEEVMNVSSKLGSLENYPLVRIDDERYEFEWKKNAESEWEVCER